MIEKFAVIIAEQEKQYNTQNKKVLELNEFLYEYEMMSMDVYSHASKEKVYSDEREQEENNKLLLFNNPENAELKKDFEALETLKNPFTELKLWMMYEGYEIAAIFEAL